MTRETLNILRIIPRDADFLDRKTGSRGEIFYDKDTNTLRLYDGQYQGGYTLAKADLTNIFVCLDQRQLNQVFFLQIKVLQ